jgi:hypothetical protein
MLPPIHSHFQLCALGGRSSMLPPQHAATTAGYYFKCRCHSYCCARRHCCMLPPHALAAASTAAGTLLLRVHADVEVAGSAAGQAVGEALQLLLAGDCVWQAHLAVTLVPARHPQVDRLPLPALHARVGCRAAEGRSERELLGGMEASVSVSKAATALRWWGGRIGCSLCRGCSMAGRHAMHRPCKQ